MSNGSQCCALEICCDVAALRTNLPGMIAKQAGVAKAADHEKFVGHLLDFMQAEGLAFAPESFRDVVQDIVTAERRRVAGGK